MSDQKQFSYQCRCSFVEVNLNLNFFIKLPTVAVSLSCPLKLLMCFFFLSSFFPCDLKQIYNDQIRNLLNPNQQNLVVGN